MNASAAMTSAVSTSIIVDPGNAAAAAAPATRRTADGRVQFESDRYLITAGDDGEVVVENKATGEIYRIWGDPHVEIDGAYAFDFWGRTTFVLDDGTKLTVETVVYLSTSPWLVGETIVSRVVIISGDYGVDIVGVESSSGLDGIGYTEHPQGGAQLDQAVGDGNVLYENALDSGLIVYEGEHVIAVDQRHINATDKLQQALSALKRWYQRVFNDFHSIRTAVLSGTLQNHDPDAKPPEDADAERRRALPDTALAMLRIWLPG